MQIDLYVSRNFRAGGGEGFGTSPVAPKKGKKEGVFFSSVIFLKNNAAYSLNLKI